MYTYYTYIYLQPDVEDWTDITWNTYRLKNIRAKAERKHRMNVYECIKFCNQYLKLINTATQNSKEVTLQCSNTTETENLNLI